MLEVSNSTKTCTKCKITKPKDKFYKQKSRKDGLEPSCKDCKKKYAIANKDRIYEYRKKYQADNRSKLIEDMKTYGISNRDKISERGKAYYSENIEKIKEKAAKYRRSDRGKAVKKNLEAKRRLKYINGDVTNDQLLELQTSAKFCYWCNRSLKKVKIHIDHYVPISKGGKHTLNNLVVSCQPCNNKKYSKDPIAFANSLGRLL